MCTCNGIVPSEVLQQYRDGYRKQVNILLAEKNERMKSKAINIRAMMRRSKQKEIQSSFPQSMPFRIGTDKGMES